MTAYRAPRTADGVDRTLAMINYGLLVASLAFAGLPAIAALLIAYFQRPESPPQIKGHLTFQIRIFWIGFTFSLIAALCLLADLFIVGAAFIEYARAGGTGFPVEAFGTPALVLASVAAASVFATVVWTIGACGFGIVRLAGGRGIGQSDAP